MSGDRRPGSSTRVRGAALWLLSGATCALPIACASVPQGERSAQPAAAPRSDAGSEHPPQPAATPAARSSDSTYTLRNQLPPDWVCSDVQYQGSRFAVGGVRGQVECRQEAPNVCGDFAQGTLDRDQMLRVIGDGNDGVLRCYERALSQDNQVATRLHINFTILPTGRTTDVGFYLFDRKPGPAEQLLASCLAREIHSWQFPAPSGGPVCVSMPFHVDAAGF